MLTKTKKSWPISSSSTVASSGVSGCRSNCFDLTIIRSSSVDDVLLAGLDVDEDEEVVADQLQLDRRLVRRQRLQVELLRLDDHPLELGRRRSAGRSRC